MNNSEWLALERLVHAICASAVTAVRSIARLCLHQRLIGDEVGIVLRQRDREPPRGCGPVQKRHVGNVRNVRRRRRIAPQLLSESAVPHVQAAKTVITRAQVEPSRPRR
jgi:hypothetical protein